MSNNTVNLAAEGMTVIDFSKQLMVMTFGNDKEKNILREKEDGSLEFTGDANKAAKIMFTNLSSLHSRYVSQAKGEIDKLNESLKAARAVLREALDHVRVHPCDEHNDEVRSRGLSPEMLALYKAMK